jgi:hypothetical protein
MNDAAKSVLKSSGFDIDKRNADGRWTLPVPGTFVIDRSGHIAYAHVDADYRNLLNRRRSSRYVGHYGASRYRIDVGDRVIG